MTSIRLGFSILAALSAVLGAASPACAAVGVQAAPLPVAVPPAAAAAGVDPIVDLQTYRLWQTRAIGATSDDPAETPTLTVFRPQAGRANGTAVIVAPGGGYMALSGKLEGRQVADWFADHGVTAFVLRYRVGPRARLPLPLVDGTRAVRFVRGHAATFMIDPARIGMIGFSAGGHLAAMVATAKPNIDPAASDPLDRVSSRPDFLGLAYPWLEATSINATGQSQYCMFAGRTCRAQDYRAFLPARDVTANTPPTFLYHTATDSLVAATGSLRFYEALFANKVPVELHVFGSGEHGSGLGGADPALSRWPELLENWLRKRDLLSTGSSPRR